MRIWFRRLFLKEVRIGKTLPWINRLVSLVLLLVLSAGCSQRLLPAQLLPFSIPNQASTVDFQLQVTPAQRPGVYIVRGTTDLPDSDRITVAAIRYLRPDNPVVLTSSQNPTYSILAYQEAKIANGKWETALNLWQVAPAGQFQETWQLDQAKLGLSLDPEPEVTFLATLAPTDSLAALELQLAKQDRKLTRSLVRSTAEGERYLQASQVLPIALPTGKTVPPQPRSEDANGGWGDRYVLLPEPQNPIKLEQPGKRRTDAPLSPAEFLQ